MNKSLDKLFWLQSKNWFRQNLGAKIITILLFVFFVGVLLTIIYKFTGTYLYYFRNTDGFGKEVSIYILRIVSLAIFSLGIISTMIMANKSLFENKNISHWLVSGMKMKDIFWKYINRTCVGSWMVMILLLPIFWSFNRYFFRDRYFLIKILLELIWLSSISTFLGFLLSMAWAKLTKFKTKGWYVVLTMILFLGIFFKMALPKETLNVYSAKNFDEFVINIRSLPANSKVFASNWMIDVLMNENVIMWAVLQIILLAVVLGILWWISEKYLLTIWQEKNGLDHKTTKKKRKLWLIKNRILQMSVMDLLAFGRQKSDRSYLIFVIFLLAILGFTTVKVLSVEQLSIEFDVAMKLIIYLSLILIGTVTAIRLLFPMAAKEKRMAWFNFSLPIKKDLFLDQKIISGVIVAIVFSIVGLFFTSNLNANLLGKIWFEICLFFNIVSIYCLQVMCGFIQPNFVEDENEEAVSTNTTGFISLILSAIITTPMAIFLYLVFSYNYVSQWICLGFVLSTAINLVLYKIALNEMGKYNL